MATLPLLFCILLFFSVFVSAFPRTPLRGIFINCGGSNYTDDDGRQWVSDKDFVFSGKPNTSNSSTTLEYGKTFRTFPEAVQNPRKKFCYVISVDKNKNYMVRTWYFHAGMHGRGTPFVFDQIIEGTVWNTVNTMEDYANGYVTYEGVFRSKGKNTFVCLAANNLTDSYPFINAIELIQLEDSTYETLNFTKYGLHAIARHNFGSDVIRYPDDQFDRIWKPFNDSSVHLSDSNDVIVSGLLNLPPSKLFDTSLTTDSDSRVMNLKWPVKSLPMSNYYISLYFADDRNALSREFGITVNNITYYGNLSVSSAGAAVYTTCWPLYGLTTVTLTAPSTSAVGPLINAAELYKIVVLQGSTHIRDVIALNKIRESLNNPPNDWRGDPCLPYGYSWTGVTCDAPKLNMRVTSLNLTGMKISGNISSSVANLTAITDLWLGENALKGTIPNMTSLRRLEKLHLENNQLSGPFPLWLGDIPKLREVFLQNNRLTGEVPEPLKQKFKSNLQYFGNSLTEPASPPAP